ncbi:MAG: endonuclease domain-containing protein [Terricaulis sp.]
MTAEAGSPLPCKAGEGARSMRKYPTKAEKLLWDRLRAHRLNGLGFRRQAPIAAFVVDFVCHEYKLVVEVDGPVHEDPEQAAFDLERTKIIEASGFLVVRVNERVVRDGIDHVCAWIMRVGTMIISGERVPEPLRRLDNVPLP